jgi:hypothetical protein
VRHVVLGPLGSDEGGHAHRPVASLTHRTTDRLRTVRMIVSPTAGA